MKRFYKSAAAEAAEGGWRVVLDARPIKTAGGRPQVVPTERLALALAAEWAAQGEEIAPALFVQREFADYAIDVVAPYPSATVRALLAYAETDTLCYRGETGEALAERQAEVWEPLLNAAEHRWDVHFTRIDGVIHKPQPAGTLARLQSVLGGLDAWQLAALNTLANLSASLVIGLAALEPGADPEVLWQAANLEEDWQAELWGKDWEAMELREKRFTAFAAAMRFAELSRTEP